ncbi:hypothetical protein H0H92_010726 [Tricholoma furcatifolium]|nr:hypothetical protein H0H92_010726 [Tricholoma furcatifolium]
MSRTKEPVQETLEMDYYQRLVNYYASCVKVEEIQQTWQAYDHNNLTVLAPAGPGAKRRYTPETRLRHAREQVQQHLLLVQDLELQLDIAERWTPECEEWKAAAILVGQWQYQRCLNELEGLVVSRMFELMKMNLSQTGYKLRKHIAKALKVRSQAIKNALERYNAAAASMSPCRPSLAWDEVMEYAFLSDFELLQNCREDVRQQAWGKPSARLAMDKYFRMERAREEITCLNIEIQCVITHMQDEETYLLAKEREVACMDPALVYHVKRYREE